MHPIIGLPRIICVSVYMLKHRSQHAGPRPALRWLAVIFFGLAGISHLIRPGFFIQIVPPMFPDPGMLVFISGICEIAGGFGLLIPPLRRAAGWGLIGLLIAVYPANFYMAGHPEQFHIAPWILWARLPFQFIFIAWIWFVALQRPAATPHSGLTPQ